MPEIAISVKNISKTYQLSQNRTDSAKELINNWFSGSYKRARKEIKIVHALSNIDFELKRGESVGIIGKNGAGKSTLLKVLSGITRPTEGTIEINGSINSILDMRAGFHPELTGRENIFLKGELIGLKRKDIRQKLDDIIDFSGISEFIDHPVKYYSSGMFVRLAFSVISHIDADIILLDEILSVGDAAFRLKSARTLQSLFNRDKTIILVSHNASDILKLCTRAIELENGKIISDGDAESLVTKYTAQAFKKDFDESQRKKKKTASITDPGTKKDVVTKKETRPKSSVSDLKKTSQASGSILKKWDNISDAPGNDSFKLLSIGIRGRMEESKKEIKVGDEILVEYEYWKKGDNQPIDVGFVLTQFGNIVFATNTILTLDEDTLKSGGYYKAVATIPGDLLNNSVFALDVHAVKNRNEVIFNMSDVIYFVVDEIDDPLIHKLKKYMPTYPGSIRPKLKWEVRKHD